MIVAVSLNIHDSVNKVAEDNTNLIVAVPLDIHDAVEVLVPQVNVHQHTVRKAVHLKQAENSI